MISHTLKAKSIHSRSLLLNKAMIHLMRYYNELSQECPMQVYQYIPSRKGEILEGLITVDYGQQYLIASVTTCDVDYAKGREMWINQRIDVPQPDPNLVFLDALAFAVMGGIASYGYLKDEWVGAFVMGFVVAILYFVARMHESDEYGRRLKKKPSNMLRAFLPHFDFPTNEDWLVVGDELFDTDLNINLPTLQALCQQEGIGLLVLNQSGEMKKYADPVFKNNHIKDKYDDPNIMTHEATPKDLKEMRAQDREMYDV
jgi:hypothetical protein